MSIKAMTPPIGINPFDTRTTLTNLRFSPVISLESTSFATELIQQQYSTSILDLFNLYGDNFKYEIPNQQFRIVNNQLITRNYSSFPIRFIDLESVLSGGGVAGLSEVEKKLYGSCKETGVTEELYRDMFGHMVGNDDLLLPFETFNHPISQVFVISMQDSIDELRNMIVKFRNHNYPLYFQMNDLLFHVVILYQEDSNDVISFQNEIKSKLNLNSTVIPIETTVDTTIRYKLNEFIVKNLIPHIQMKIRLWDDQYLQPKKSITNRFISVSKRFFNNNSDSQLASSTSTASTDSPFNYNENYYYKGSSQQVLRKLADWSLMINDFKYAYTIYDLIKKDYSQDKAWIYVASTQEMCIVSLLLAQTDQSSISGPDKNTLRKIRHDIIEPFMDNLTYTYKSRFNYTHLNRKCLVIVIELLLCMNKLYNLSYWWIDLIELYLLQLVNDIEHETQGQHSIIKALFYERLGYSFGHYYIPPIVDKFEEEKEVDEEEDVNPNKLIPPVNNSVIGLTRFRKSSLWYLLSIREWLGILDKSKLKFVIDNINVEYQVHDSVIKEILQG